MLFLHKNPEGLKYKKRLEKKHGKAKALSILAHKLGRAVYPDPAISQAVLGRWRANS